MGRVLLQSESDSKSRLVKQISDISKSAAFCQHWHHHHHHHHHRNDIKSQPFIDWYHLLQVEENVGVEIIRKKYHKYALLLHPDKNNHPDAEFAFKLVSEAYACLSDNARRAAFDRERLDNLCKECIKKTSIKGSSASERLRSKKIAGRVKEMKARFMEEARVIENCLKANTTRTDSPGRDNVGVFEKEMPVFNPGDYLSHGYPHLRARGCNKLENLSRLHKGYQYEHWQQAKGNCDSPIFECKSNRSSFQLKSARVHS